MSRSRVAKIGVLIFLALVTAGLLFLLFEPGRSEIERIEAEHGIQLPSSTTSVRAMGDASNRILRATGLDRGASSIIVIDRADLPTVLNQFPALSEGTRVLGGSPSIAPGNSIYQPLSVPWDIDQPPETTFSTTEPPSGGDFTDIGLYTLDDPDVVALWIYTDWN